MSFFLAGSSYFVAEQSESKSDKKIYTSLLVGKWVRTDKYVRTVMEYFKDGTNATKFVVQQSARHSKMAGTWKLDGEKIIQTLGTGRRTR